MGFTAYITIITFLTVGVGFSAICLVEELSPAYIAFAGIVTALSLLINIKERFSKRPPAFLWNMLAAFVFIFFLADYFAISKTLAGAGARFLTILIVLKLYDLKSARDYLLLYVLVFFELLSAASSTVNPLFFVVLSLFIISSIWAMIVFSIKKDFEVYRNDAEMPDNMFGWAFFLATIAVTAASILMTLALFFVIPRMGVGLFEKKTLSTIKVSGFSDTVELGSIGQVKLDPTVVMRVGYDTPPPATSKPLYLRGTAMDSYDGKSWRRTDEKKTLLKKGKNGVFSSGIYKKTPVTGQRIMLEPLETDVIFTPAEWVEISAAFNNLWTDASGALYLPSPPYSRIEYTVTSHMPKDMDDENMVEHTGEGGKNLSRYLQLPPGPEDIIALSSNITVLSSSITALSSNITEKTGSDLDRAKAIERYLKENYRYTLNPRKGRGKTPLDDFLFFTKEGYCEHYATAMAIMLRARGIPSRLVTGFAGGQWNGFGNYYLIRQEDAHTWVEAYIKGRGWMKFEPTASAGLSTPVGSSSLGLYLDSLRWRWARHVIGYSFSDQIRIARNVEINAGGLMAFIKRNIPGLSGKRRADLKAFSIIVFAAGAALFFLFMVFLKRNAAACRKTPGFYLQMLKVLKKKGFAKKDCETPLEFAKRTRSSPVLRLTEIFQLERYGERAPSEREKTEVKTLLSLIRYDQIRPD